MDIHTHSTRAKRKNGHWLWLVGAIAFLIPSLLPPFNPPSWFPFMWEGGLIWQLMRYIGVALSQQPSLGAMYFSYPPNLGTLIVAIFVYGSLPLTLPVFAVLLWRRRGKGIKRSTTGHGLRVFLLAGILAPISVVIVASGICLPFYYVPSWGIALTMLWLVICWFTVASAILSFPLLLIAGACLGRLQETAQ